MTTMTATLPALPSMTTPEPSTTEAALQEKATKLPFLLPKLNFLTPQLTKEGNIDTLTAGIIGTFS